MADPIDIANELVANEVSRALDKIRKQASNAKGSQYCLACGENVPDARRELGFNLCLPCAAEEERKKSLFIDY